MLDKIRPLAAKYAEIEYSLSQPEVWSDPDTAARLSRVVFTPSVSWMERKD